MTTPSRYAFASLAIGFFIGCAAPAADIGGPVDTGEPPAPRHTAPPPSGGATLPTPSATPAPAAAPASAPVACPELGINGALFCDGFEGAAMAPSWTPVVDGGEVHPFYAQRAAAGSHSLEAAFDPLPAVGRAALSYDGAFKAGTKPTSIAMQFSFYLPKDGYPTVLPLGGFHGTSGALTVSLSGSQHITLTDKLAGGNKTITLGNAQLGTWQCVELQVDSKGTLDAWLGTTHTPTGKLASGATAFSAIDAAEVGLSYDEGKNPNASVVAFFDDVVVAPTAVGCLH